VNEFCECDLTGPQIYPIYNTVVSASPRSRGIAYVNSRGVFFPSVRISIEKKLRFQHFKRARRKTNERLKNARTAHNCFRPLLLIPSNVWRTNFHYHHIFPCCFQCQRPSLLPFSSRPPPRSQRTTSANFEQKQKRIETTRPIE